MNVRFVVCIDISGADSLEDAYRKMRNQLPSNCAYETSDEYYLNDTDEPGDPKALDRAIVGMELDKESGED